jgi:lambda repressor-like predicted transcriptional regulator
MIMKANALLDDSTLHDHSRGWSLKSYVAGIVGGLKKSAADRSLRRQLMGLDDAILRDIGIADDEIWRVRHGDAFTPRAWM